MTGSTIIRRVLLVLLLAALGVGAWRLSQTKAAPPDPFLNADAQLQQRLDTYIALRHADDWVALYPMSDPEHRKKVDMRTFLSMYGQGLLKVHDIRVNAIRIDQQQRTADVDLTTEGELVIERLPAEFRNLQEQHAEHLRRSTDHTLAWVWRGDAWYFEMDQEIVTGVTSGGKAIQLAPPKPDAPLIPPAPGS